MAASMWVKVAWLPCHIHAYTVYTSIGGKGRSRTRHDLQDHCTQARKSSGERSTLDLKPVRKETHSPKQEPSVSPQTGPWSNKILKKEKRKKIYMLCRTCFYFVGCVRYILCRTCFYFVGCAQVQIVSSRKDH